MALGPDDYREGALRRLEDAWRLFDGQQWEGAVYLGGRAAQGMLRSLIAREPGTLELGHSLREHLKRVRACAVLSPVEDDDALADAINELVILWRNDLRFTGTRRFRRLLTQAGRIKRLRGRAIVGEPEKPNARAVLDAAQTVVTKGELAWRRLKKK